MISHLFFSHLVLVALVWLCLMLQWAWPSDPAAVCPTAPEPTPPVPKRTREITPFAGLTTKPPCDACAHASGFCRKVRFLGQNPKIGYQEFNELQTPKLSKKQLCDRTISCTDSRLSRMPKA